MTTFILKLMPFQSFGVKVTFHLCCFIKSRKYKNIINYVSIVFHTSYIHKHIHAQKKFRHLQNSK